MLSKNNMQIDVFNQMIFDKLIPKDHLLVKIDSIIDFSFIYDMVKDKYSSDIGRASKDPAMMIKILLLEYLYTLSDPQVVTRASTDIVFRWFLGLSIDDKVPDETTICHFRCTRLGEQQYDEIFNEIVKKCIENDIVKTKRYIVDSTHVEANTGAPFVKKLVRDAYRKVIKEIEKFDEQLASHELEGFEKDIQEEYDKGKKVESKKHLEITLRHMDYLYLKTYDELQKNNRYLEAYGVCYDIIDQYLNDKKDKIISVVDTDARTANKSPGKVKTGYKDHIIVDEDSEIILASSQTPFNVGDEKKLEELVRKVEENFNLKSEELSADKVYGTINNRAYLKDNKITSNIQFYKQSEREIKVFGLKDFVISDDLKSVTCPNGITTTNFTAYDDKKGAYLVFKFSEKDCLKCPLQEQCILKDKNGDLSMHYRRLSLRYDTVLTDMKRVEMPELQEAANKSLRLKEDLLHW